MISSTLFVVLTLALISASAAVATWAQVVNTNEAKFDTDNTFTNNPKIAVRLAEPLWDANTYDDNGDGNDIPDLTGTNDHFDIGATDPDTDKGQYVNDPTTTTAVQKTPAQLGYNIAQSYQSGDTIPKNPSLKNTSANDTAATARSDDDADSKNGNVSRDEWVAMGVKYTITLPDTIYYANGGGDGKTASNRMTVKEGNTTAGTSFAAIAGKTLTYASRSKFANALATLNSASDRIVATDTVGQTWTDISNNNGTLYRYNTKLHNATAPVNTNTLFDSVTIKTF